MNQELDKKKPVEETPIDFKKLFKDILKHRTLYYKVIPVTFIVSAILMLSIPNYYNVKSCWRLDSPAPAVVIPCCHWHIALA